MEKRFPCAQCGNTFRTRNGLAGHIRFKHGAAGNKGTSSSQRQPDAQFLYGTLYVWDAFPINVSPEKKEEIRQVLLNWIPILQVLHPFGLRATCDDFKQYVISNVGRVLNGKD